MSANPKRHIAREKGKFHLPRCTSRYGHRSFSGRHICGDAGAYTALCAGSVWIAGNLHDHRLAVFSVLGGARYELAIMLPDDTDHEAANVFHMWQRSSWGPSVSSLCLRSRFSTGGSRTSWPSPWSSHGCGPFRRYSLVSGFNQGLGVLVRRMKRFRQVAWSRMAQSFGTVAMQIALFSRTHKWGLV